MAPENTDLSFESALLFGFDGVEIDIQVTKDRKIVVIHNERVNRTSDGHGKVSNLTLGELKKLNFAYKFDKNISKQKIMTYEEFLSKYHTKFKYINVEIKIFNKQNNNLEQMIWEIHKKIKPKCKVIYSSFNFDFLKRMRSITNDVILALLLVNVKRIKKIKTEVQEICDYIHPWFKLLINKKSFDFLKGLNMKVNVWTIDRRNTKNKWTKDSINNLEQLKNIDFVDMIISNSKI